MDQLKIITGFTRNIVSKILKRAIKKKTGCDIDLWINGFEVNVTEDKASIHIDMDADIPKDELMKLFNDYI